MDGRDPVGRRGRLRRTYLVECFASTAGDADSADQQARAIDEAFRGSRRRLEYLAGLVIADDEQLLLIVRGPDAGSVRAACLEAGLVVERVAEVTTPDGWPRPTSPVPSRLAPRGAGCGH